MSIPWASSSRSKGGTKDEDEGFLLDVDEPAGSRRRFDATEDAVVAAVP